MHHRLVIFRSRLPKSSPSSRIFSAGTLRDLLDALRRIRRHRGLELLEANRLSGKLAVVGAKAGVLLDEVSVPRPVGDEQRHDPVGDREVRMGLELQIVVGVRGGARAPRADVDDGDLLAPRPPVQHPREQHRVHLRGVVAPHDEHVAGVQVVVAARGLVHAVGRQKTRHRRRHAQARVGVDLIVG
jgi:hypothetical protein